MMRAAGLGVFHPRCPRVLGPICVEQELPLGEAEPGHLMR